MADKQCIVKIEQSAGKGGEACDESFMSVSGRI